LVDLQGLPGEIHVYRPLCPYSQEGMTVPPAKFAHRCQLPLLYRKYPILDLLGDIREMG